MGDILPLFKYSIITLAEAKESTVLSPSAATHGLISVMRGGRPE